MTTPITVHEFFLMFISIYRNRPGGYSISFNAINRFKELLKNAGITYKLESASFTTYMIYHTHDLDVWEDFIYVNVNDKNINNYWSILPQFDVECRDAIDILKDLLKNWKEPIPTYTPTPFDSSDISISDDLLELSELVAKNSHDIWAENCINDGWKYGETRCDEKKQHPCLVPYEELSCHEQEHNLNAAVNTLKYIIGLGYKITKE